MAHNPSLRQPTGPPTICKCGLAESYHGGQFSSDHEYEPRYEPMAWQDGYARALADSNGWLNAHPGVRMTVEDHADWYRFMRAGGHEPNAT